MSEGDHRVTRAETAERLGVSVQTVDRYAMSGRLHRTKNRITGRVFYSADEVEHMRREREEAR
jgi:predicted site-specific integrase-resolvase